jgi:hypothetical protein
MKSFYDLYLMLGEGSLFYQQSLFEKLDSEEVKNSCLKKMFTLTHFNTFK